MSEWKVAKPTKDEEPGAISTATITRVEVQKASQYYNGHTDQPDQDITVIYTKGKKGDIKLCGIPMPPKGEAFSPKSYGAKFIATYGKPPAAGMRVQVQNTSEGYKRIVW